MKSRIPCAIVAGLLPVLLATGAPPSDASEYARQAIANLADNTDASRIDLSDWEMARRRLRAQVDQWLERLESGPLESFAVRLVEDMLFTNTGVLARGRPWDLDAELPPVAERREFVRKVLEPDRYDRLAQALGTYAVADRPASHERDLATAFLGKAMAFFPLADRLQQELERMPEGEDGDDAKRRRAALVVALLFLDAAPPPRAAAAGLLANRTLPSPWRRDVFSALYRTGTPAQRDEAVRLGVEADDALVFHEILDIPRVRTVPPQELHGAMLAWHGRTADEVEGGAKLSQSKEVMYMRLTTRLAMLGRSGALSPEDRGALAIQCRRLLAAGSPHVRRSAAKLLGTVGDEDRDGGFLAALLGDSQPEVRSEAASALGRSFPNTRGRSLAVLVGMLDDPESRVRDFALYALWREHDPAKAHGMFTPETFEQQKTTTLAWLRAHRGIEPAQAGTKGKDGTAKP